MNRYKYILFDWDGCLAKTLDLWLDLYKELANSRGLDLSGMPDLEIVDKSFGKWSQGLANLGITDSDAAYEEAAVEIVKRAERVDLYDGAKTLLSNLKAQDKQMALLTSSYLDWIQKPLAYHQLERFFKKVIAKDDVEKGKPDPEIIFKAMRELKAVKNETVIIGDSNHDIRAGRNAGITTVLFFPKNNEKFYRQEDLEKEKPDFVIKRLLDLTKILIFKGSTLKG